MHHYNAFNFSSAPSNGFSSVLYAKKAAKMIIRYERKPRTESTSGIKKSDSVKGKGDGSLKKTLSLKETGKVKVDKEMDIASIASAKIMSKEINKYGIY